MIHMPRFYSSNKNLSLNGRLCIFRFPISDFRFFYHFASQLYEPSLPIKAVWAKSSY